MSRVDTVEKRLIKTDSELIFKGDKVYKRFTTPLVDERTIDDLLRLDKLANLKPHFMGVSSYADTPFNTALLPADTKILVMRYLPEDHFVSRIADKDILTESHLKEMACALYRFHLRTSLSPTSLGVSYLIDRFIRDRDLIMSKVQLNTISRSYFRKFVSLLDKSMETLKGRSQNLRLVEGHGDLNLDHIHFYDNYVTFIDFSHNTKYRYDDVSRDVAGICLHLVELGRRDFAKAFLAEYSRLSNDDNLDVMVNLQIGKKVLLKYFIYAGGFDQAHYDIDILESVLRTVENLRTFG